MGVFSMNNELILKMMQYEKGQPGRIQHFTKVYMYAKLIGEMEKLSEEEQFILETAAIVHDIGIKASEEKYGDDVGKHQEELGPDIARKMLSELGYDEKIIERVCYLVGHHHTYHDMDGLDYQILVEADFLVNLFENGNKKASVFETYNNIFRTDAGKTICKEMFDI
jgi:HD superfamily phosphodiesterase